jgi:hypothetical protein
MFILYYFIIIVFIYPYLYETELVSVVEVAVVGVNDDGFILFYV